MSAAPLRWRVGDVAITQIVESSGSSPPGFLFADLSAEQVRSHAWLRPHFATAEGRLIASIHAFVVESCGRTIVVDTCVGNDKQRALAAWSQLHGPFLRDFAAAGFAPERVDVVVCTHFHSDHVGWNTRLANGRWVPTFPNAQYVFSKEEYAQYQPENVRPESPPLFMYSYQDSVLPVIESGQALIVSGEHQVNEILTVLPSPGHTPGHVTIRAADGNQAGLFLGDVIHNPVQIADPDLNSAYCEIPDVARRSRRQLLERAVDTNALLVPGHFLAPHVGRVAREDDHYRFIAGT